MVFFSSLFPTTLEPLSYAFFPGQFLINVFWAVSDSLSGGVASASGGALGMDCLPIGPDGRPKNAGRDQSLQGTSGQIPGALMPIVLAALLSSGLFPSHLWGYRCFYAAAAVLGVLRLPLLALAVHPAEERLGRSLQCTRHRFRAAHDAARRRRRSSVVDMLHQGVPNTMTSTPGLSSRGTCDSGGGVPIGARLCDALLFATPQTNGSGNMQHSE